LKVGFDFIKIENEGWVIKTRKKSENSFVVLKLFFTFALRKRNIMPKMKTNSSAKKRFKMTGTGKIKRSKAYKNHILTKKSKGRKKRLSQAGLVNSTEMPRVLRMLGK
jgi:large subunit ribosomal protein L35